jgi:nucleotide-binding universal stress UspA family protein
MSNVLVPLDGSRAAESVLTEAIRLAGPRGDIVLMRDIGRVTHVDMTEGTAEARAVQSSDEYLADRVSTLERAGLRARAETFVLQDPAYAIDEAARIFDVDFIACHTDGRSGLRRMIRPSVAWAALTHSPVPVLIQRDGGAGIDVGASNRVLTILVPLDGSDTSETAIPIAQLLAAEWGAKVVLARVILVLADAGEAARFREEDEQKTQEYLAGLADLWPQPVSTVVASGNVVDTLEETVRDASITHVIMASHGRTGLRRTLLGSVADELIHRLSIPIIVVPAGSRQSISSEEVERARELVPV